MPGKVIRFEIPGDPVGYTATTAKGKWSKQYTKYSKYAKNVRKIARAIGLRIPLLATKDKPIVIKTIAYFRTGVHCDPGNVQKGVVDALFYDDSKVKVVKGKVKVGGKGDDKYTGGAFPPPRYDAKNPRVIVIIKPYTGDKKSKKVKK